MVAKTSKQSIYPKIGEELNKFKLQYIYIMYPYIRIKILFLKLMAGDNAHNNSFREGKKDVKLHIAKYPHFIFFKQYF